MSKATNVIAGLMILAGVGVFAVKYSNMHAHSQHQLEKILKEQNLTVVENKGYVELSNPWNICNKTEDMNTNVIVTNKDGGKSNILVCSDAFGKSTIRILP